MNDLNSQGIKYNKNKKKYNRLVSKRKLKKISRGIGLFLYRKCS